MLADCPEPLLAAKAAKLAEIRQRVDRMEATLAQVQARLGHVAEKLDRKDGSSARAAPEEEAAGGPSGAGDLSGLGMGFRESASRPQVAERIKELMK